MAVDAFLKIDGISGESSDHKHKNEIELLSFSWGIENSGRASGGGGGAGKVTVHDFRVVKLTDSASPALFERCCTGEHIPNVSMVAVSASRAKKGQVEFLKIKLTDVLISSVSPAGQAGGDAMEQVSFSFANIDVAAADPHGKWNEVSCGASSPGDIIGEKDHH